MMGRLLTLAAIGALAACTATAQPSAQAHPTESAVAHSHADVCEIAATRTRDGVRIEALAHADRALRGDYELVVTKTGGGGSSDVVQGGPLDVAAGDTAPLSGTELSLERGARYRAVLTLTDTRGATICRDERRS